jgi:hypothetical protein
MSVLGPLYWVLTLVEEPLILPGRALWLSSRRW